MGQITALELRSFPIQVRKEPLRHTVLDAAQVVARAIIQNNAGEILLCQRAKNGVWELPGGKHDPGERWIDTVARETREETGIHARFNGLEIPYELRLMHGRAPYGGKHYYGVAFTGTYVAGVPTPSEETADVRWIDPKELPKIGQVRPDTYKALARATLIQ